MDLPESVRDDLLVALVAAGCTVVLTLALRYGVGLRPPLLPRLSPMVPYFGYLFSKRNGLLSLLSTATWVGVTVLVTLVTFASFVV
ncbi:hypothetical protein [Salinigranum halophilum]|uniref:hypothetical protein n=1 Tax=Salinigranum halophilum TaxID=2565931 RepID=UPI00191C3420|nr:hypothetical protein [Salinigranum halophilum]